MSKRVSIKERAFSTGNIIGVNGSRTNRDTLLEQLRAHGYQVERTPHFLICRREGTPVLLVHWFAPQAIDADLGRYFLAELKPLGLLAGPEQFADVFGAVVGSLFPQDPQQAWHLFGANTLQRYHQLLSFPPHALDYDSPIDAFATLYRRVCELQTGQTLLDAGCSFGFLPLVMAERVPGLTKIVGIDLQDDPFPVTRALAAERGLSQVEYMQADLLSEGIKDIGRFDTVTVLHVLEHFTEEEMYRVLANLLHITSKRLIIGVPYEEGEPEVVYGHRQLFWQEKLEEVGRWCVQQAGRGRWWCEECAGGVVVIDVN